MFSFQEMDMNDQKTRESVKEYYGKVLSSTESLKTSACVPSSRPHPLIIKALKLVPESVKAKYYGEKGQRPDERIQSRGRFSSSFVSLRFFFFFILFSKDVEAQSLWESEDSICWTWDQAVARTVLLLLLWGPEV